MMRIAMVVFNQVGQGTYWRSLNLARSLVQMGNSVTLIATSRHQRTGVKDKEIDGVTVVESPDLLPGSLRSGWDPWNSLNRISWLRRRSFDLVHAFEGRPTVIFPSLYMRRTQEIPFVMDWCDWFGRGGSVEERPNPLVRAVLRPVETFFEEHYRTRADGTTVINHLLRQKAIDLGVQPETILLLRNGSDPSIQPITIEAARRHTGLPPGIPIIGFVGGTYSRDARFMASAFRQVHQAYPHARLLLVGNFNRNIEQWIDGPAMVFRTGPVPVERLYTYLSACDLCWLPLVDSGANRGRWPYKLNDYLTVGRPVVATAVGDLAKVIPQYNAGLVTPDDPHSFAQATIHLLEDSELRSRLGSSARQAAETDFSWSRLAAELEGFYRRVLAGL